VAASQLVTPPPKQKLAALIPLMDPASVTSPTRSANSSEDAADPAQGVHINSKLKTLLADLTKVREEHDGAKVSTLFFLSNPLSRQLTIRTNQMLQLCMQTMT
jgi:hypothetical protein